MKLIYMFLMISCSVEEQWNHSSHQSVKKRRELVPLTPNILNQARFYQLRKNPFKSIRKQKTQHRGPVAICSKGRIGIALNRRFSGRIFASHLHDNPHCIQYATKDTNNKFSTSFGGPCGVKTVRRHDSLAYNLRVIISFNYDHLTEEDQIFDITCTYNLRTANLSAHYDAIGFNQHSVSHTAPVPQCEYSLHRQHLRGPRTVAARVGDMIYHRWSCPSADFSFKVYRCFVHDGMHKSYMIIDDHGCSLDEEIIPHPTYDMNNGIVSTPAKAFRFAQSKRVHFNCLLSVCPKWDSKCMQQIPPKCGRSQKKRQLPAELSIEERLLRVHSLLQGTPLGNETWTQIPLSLSSDELNIEDSSSYTDCDPTDLVHWIYFLCFSNILFVVVSIIACGLHFRNRYMFKINRTNQNIGSHFKF